MRLHIAFPIVFITLFLNLCKSQRPSPCPETFHYESQSRDEEDKWYGVITLQTNEDLIGVWVKIALDRKAEILGNWFGASTSADNKEFTIKSTNYHLKAGNPVQLRFYIQYDLNQPVPSLLSIRLNGKVICNTNESHTNSNNRGSSRPNVRPSQRPQQQSANNQNRPMNVDGDSYITDQNQNNNNNNNNFAASTATVRPNTRPSGNTQQSRPQSASNSRPSQGGTTNSRPTYQNNDYDAANSGSNRPVSNAGTTVNRPLNVDVDSYGTNQNEFAPAFGSSVPDNNQYGQGSVNTNNNNNNNRLPVDNNNYDTGGSGNNLATTTIQRPSQTTNNNNNGEFFPGDLSVSRPISRPETSRPSVLLNQKPSCGTVYMRPTPLITHGLETSEGQYPWHVALYHSQGIQLTYICGGSLISEEYVVTAAHCVTNPSTGRANSPQNFLIYLGKTNLKKFGAEIQDRDVAKIIVHRDYNHTVFHNDIALLKLGRPADITNFVRPVCLWDGNTDLNNVLDQLGTVVGWGFDENGQLTTSLMQTKMPVVSSIKCVYSNPDFFSRFTFDKSYCAGFRNGTTVCNGDSGGGMIFPKTKRNGEISSWHLRGLVSVGVALQGKTSCDPSHYIVFTDVAKHLDWIRNNINDYY